MPPFGSINRRDLIRYLKDAGFDGTYPGGKHQYMVKGELKLTIPNPHQGDISPSLIEYYVKLILAEMNGKRYKLYARSLMRQ